MKNEIFPVQLNEGGTVHWRLDSESRATIQPIADEFGMTIPQFLTLHTRGRLPAQCVRGMAIDQDSVPAGFKVAPCRDKSLLKRIERAAKLDYQSIEEFAWSAIATSVRAAEDDAILSPKTGEPIADDLDLDEFIVRAEYRERS